MENLESTNKGVMLELLDNLRHRVESDEILQLFVGLEDLAGFDAVWSGVEDKFAISGFVMGAAMSRMGFTQAPVNTPDPE